jgi:hypothetical protein
MSLQQNKDQVFVVAQVNRRIKATEVKLTMATTSVRQSREMQPTSAQSLTPIGYSSNLEHSWSEVSSCSSGLQSKLSKIYHQRAIESMAPLESQRIPLPFSLAQSST